ncbi:hypothetical protein, partial [Streptomyces palmae]
DTGLRDGGPAAEVTPPISASPLWPGYTPQPQRPAQTEPTSVTPSYPPLPGVTVPAAGLRAVPLEKLLKNDPVMPRGVLGTAPGGCASRCTMRDPVYRDLTGDGREELVVAVDEIGLRMTWVEVYRAFGNRVRPVLVLYDLTGLTIETYGRDLVVNVVRGDGLTTTRYRWNGTVMAPVTPGNDAQDAEGTPTP